MINWIPVTERLPADGEEVFFSRYDDVFRGTFWAASGEYPSRFKADGMIYWHPSEQVTHWMPSPSPKPPKKQCKQTRMSDTPITDRFCTAFRAGKTTVDVIFCQMASLERENAKLREDKARLDYLEALPFGIDIIVHRDVSKSDSVPGLRTQIDEFIRRNV